MALTLAQQQDVARRWIVDWFVAQNVTANLGYDDVLAAMQALDTCLDTALNAQSPAWVTTSTLLVNLNNALPANFKANATTNQKLAVLGYVLFKRAGAF